MTERNAARSILFRNLTKISHRQYGATVLELTQALNADPNFVARALVHIFQTSQIRDLQDAAVITLLQADPQYPELRQVGRALFGLDFYETCNTEGLRSLEPFRLLRIWDYIRGHEIIEEVRTIKGKEMRIQKRINRKTPGTMSPRLMKTLITDWFNFIMRFPTRFDGIVEINRRELKWAYESYHIALTPRAKQILYDNCPPTDSKLYWIKEIAKATDIVEASRKAMEAGIQYTILDSILPKDDVSANIARVHAMSPNEAANSIGWVEKSGILSIPEVAAVFEEKVSQATSAASLKGRKSTQAKTERMQQIVEKAADRAAAFSVSKIERPMLLMVDISGSMDIAIVAAKVFLSRIVPLFAYPERDCMVVLFRDVAQVLKITDWSMSGIEKALRLVRAGGGTDMRNGFRTAIKAGWEGSDITLITDGGENRMGEFAAEVATLQDLNVSIIGLKPNQGVNIYDVRFTQSLEQRGVHVNEFLVDDPNDYYVYDQVAALLGGPRAKSLVEQIMEIQLPYVVGKK